MHNFVIAKIITLIIASKIYGKAICLICEAVFNMGIVKGCSAERLEVGGGRI